MTDLGLGARQGRAGADQRHGGGGAQGEGGDADVPGRGGGRQEGRGGRQEGGSRRHAVHDSSSQSPDICLEWPTLKTRTWCAAFLEQVASPGQAACSQAHANLGHHHARQHTTHIDGGAMRMDHIEVVARALGAATQRVMHWTDVDSEQCAWVRRR